MAKTYEIIHTTTGEKTIRCLICDSVSYNRNDVEKLYCGNCKMFHEDESKARVERYIGDNNPPVGATGVGMGQLGPEDEGELAVAVSTIRGFVHLQFGKPVSWLTIGPEGARAVALMLIEKADAIDAEKARLRNAAKAKSN